MIYVVNFPFCNFFSLSRYLHSKDLVFEIASSESIFMPDDIIVLPGVGSFDHAMCYLNKYTLTSKIRNHAHSGGKIVGICLGLQLLFDRSDESPGVEGLSLIGGHCHLIPNSSQFRVPHIGWNQLQFPFQFDSVFSNLVGPDSASIADFYFVHSYVASPSDDAAIIAFFNHPSSSLCAAVHVGNIFGLQFHPEKSGRDGYTLLTNIFRSLSLL